jgi:hypothetical protein
MIANDAPAVSYRLLALVLAGISGAGVGFVLGLVLGWLR